MKTFQWKYQGITLSIHYLIINHFKRSILKTKCLVKKSWHGSLFLVTHIFIGCLRLWKTSHRWKIVSRCCYPCWLTLSTYMYVRSTVCAHHLQGFFVSDYLSIPSVSGIGKVWNAIASETQLCFLHFWFDIKSCKATYPANIFSTCQHNKWADIILIS